MIEVKVLAAILLSLRIVSVVFLAFVISRQLKFLFQKDQILTTVRIVLMTLIGLTFIGNFVPIIIDVSTLMREDISGKPSVLLSSYALSNALTAAISAIGWWVLYRVIENERVAGGKEHTRSEAAHAKTLKEAKEDH